MIAIEPSEFADEINGIRIVLRAEMAATLGTTERKAIMLDLLYRQAHWIGGTFELLDQLIDISTPLFNRAVIAAALGSTDSAAKRRDSYVKAIEAYGHRPLKMPSGGPKKYPAFDWAKESEAHNASLMALCRSIGDERWQEVALKSFEDHGAGFPLALKILPCFGLPVNQFSLNN